MPVRHSQTFSLSSKSSGAVCGTVHSSRASGEPEVQQHAETNPHAKQRHPQAVEGSAQRTLL